MTTEPDPHYCTTVPRQDGSCEGCPVWPGCVTGDTPTPDADDDSSALDRDLVTLLGWAAGAVLVMVVILLLAPVFA